MAKNRRTIITELFQALAKNDEFDYTEEQLWDLFESCVNKKLIKKLSKERESKQDGVHSEIKSRGSSGYQYFLSNFPEPVPEGMKKREFKGAAWRALSKEEQEEWKQKAEKFNEMNGIQKKTSSMKDSQESIDEYEQLMEEWANKDPITRGPKPDRPNSQKSSPATSQKSSPTSSPPESPKEKPCLDSDNSPPDSPKEKPCQDSDSSDEDEYEDQERELLQDDCNNSDNDNDSDSDSDEEGSDEKRKEWLKKLWPTLGYGSGGPGCFKAWIMFRNRDIFGPNKDNTISNSQLNNFKNKYDYEKLKKDKDAPWFDFIKRNLV